MNANVVSFDATTLMVLSILTFIGVILAAFAMVWLFLAWRSMRSDLTRARNEIATLQQQHEAEHATHARELEATQHELAEVHTTLNTTKAELERAQDESATLRQRVTHWQERIVALERELQEQQNRADYLNRLMTEQKLEIADLTNQVARIPTLEAELQAARDTLAHLPAEAVQAADATARINELEIEVQTARETLAHLTQELARAQADAARAAELEAEVQTARAALAYLPTAPAEASDAAYVAKLEAELDAERATVVQLMDELARAQERVAQLALHAEASSEVAHWRARVAENEEYIQELTLRLEQARQRGDRLASDWEYEKIRMAELTQQLHQAQAQIAELAALHEQITQDQTRRAELMQQLEQANAQAARVVELEAHITKLQTRLARQKTQLAAVRRQAASVTRVKTSAHKSRALVTELKKQLALAKRQIKALQVQSQKREAMIVDLTTRLYRLRQAEMEKLERIVGIGPKYAARLRAGGITTITALAHATVEQVQEIIQPRRWQKPKFDFWIKQAQQLSRRRKSR